MKYVWLEQHPCDPAQLVHCRGDEPWLDRLPSGPSRLFLHRGQLVRIPSLYFSHPKPRVPLPVYQHIPCLLHSSTSTFYNPRKRSLHPIPFPLTNRNRTMCQSSSEGLLLLTENTRQGLLYDAYLLDPINGAKIFLPSLETNWHQQYRVALSYHPSHPDCVVAIPKDSGIAICNLGDQKWTIRQAPGSVQDCVVDVVAKDEQFFCLAKLSGLPSSYDIIITEDYTENDRVERLVMNCDQLSYVKTIFEKLVALEGEAGELFLVTVSSLNHCASPDQEWEPYIEIRVFRANMDESTW